jgi:uncharacterized protein YyaL (SSP411 family)
MQNEIWSQYLPNKVVASASPENPRAAELIPLLRQRPQLEGKATAYVCEHFTCKSPAISPQELAAQLVNQQPSAASH